MIQKHLSLLAYSFAFIGFIFAGTSHATAQNKKLTIEEAVLKQKTTLAPEKMVQLAWIPATENYAYIEKQNEVETLVYNNASTDKKTSLITLAELNAGIAKLYPQIAALTKFPVIKWIDQNNFSFNTEGKICNFNLVDKSVSEFNNYDKEAENLDIAEANYNAAFTRKNNLFITTRGTEKQLTHDTNEDIVNGQAAHRNEFGILKGTFWSPKGNAIAYYHMDQTMVTDYPLVDIDTKPATEDEIKYPMAGMKSHQVTVVVYNTGTGKSISLKTGEPAEQYLTNITWSPDEQFIYIAVINRAQNKMKLNMYDATHGNYIRTIFEENDTKYVEPEKGMIFLTNNADRFLWFSKRDGYNHLYLYDNNGTNLGQLTQGAFNVTDFTGFDTKGERFFYISNQESPVERHIYTYEFAKHTALKLSSVPGTHTVVFSDNGKYILDTYSSTTIPRITDLTAVTGKKIRNVLTAANPLKDYSMGEMSIFPIKAADGSTDLYCRQILPPNFNPSKKYPTLVYLYGGPHVQLVNNTWLGGADMWLHYMAQQGYVVFTLDSRGSGNRGQAFEQATYRQLGTVELADQLKGVDYLRSQSFVDTSRMGIHGWSFGGFMTTTVMTKAPNIFKAAVAGGPVIDWKYYEIMYTERYMDTPEENPKGYEDANLLNYVNNLKGKLLLIHGTADDVVVWQHSLMYLKKCIDNGVQLDYFVYPGHKHNVLGPDRVHLMTKITNYFNQNLKNNID